MKTGIPKTPRFPKTPGILFLLCRPRRLRVEKLPMGQGNKVNKAPGEQQMKSVEVRGGFAKSGFWWVLALALLFLKESKRVHIKRHPPNHFGMLFLCELLSCKQLDKCLALGWWIANQKQEDVSERERETLQSQHRRNIKTTSHLSHKAPNGFKHIRSQQQSNTQLFSNQHPIFLCLSSDFTHVFGVISSSLSDKRLLLMIQVQHWNLLGS